MTGANRLWTRGPISLGTTWLCTFIVNLFTTEDDRASLLILRLLRPAILAERMWQEFVSYPLLPLMQRMVIVVGVAVDTDFLAKLDCPELIRRGPPLKMPVL